MRKGFLAAIIAAALALSLTGATAASAATEFGDTCVGDETAPGDFTLTTLEAGNDPLPLLAPSAGVITQLKMQIEPEPFSSEYLFPTSVKVLRSAGGGNFTVVAQQALSPGGKSGTASASSRIPVQAGDRLGLHGEPVRIEGGPEASYSWYCGGLTESVLGAVPGDLAPGATAAFFGATNGRVPLAAVLQPDADNDGYGDETQDGCPQSAAYHSACPVLSVDTAAQVGRQAVTVLVATNVTAPVSVTAVAKLGKGKKVTLKAAAQTVTAGHLGHFKLKLKGKVKARLEELPPSKKLVLTITASATNVNGLVSTDQSTAKLKGQS